MQRDARRAGGGGGGRRAPVCESWRCPVPSVNGGVEASSGASCVVRITRVSQRQRPVERKAERSVECSAECISIIRFTRHTSHITQCTAVYNAISIIITILSRNVKVCLVRYPNNMLLRCTYVPLLDAHNYWLRRVHLLNGDHICLHVYATT
jgi:hypothetical protein